MTNLGQATDLNDKCNGTKCPKSEIVSGNLFDSVQELSKKKKGNCATPLNIASYHPSVPGSPFHGPTISSVIQPP